METQICSKCDIEKPLGEYRRRNDNGKYRNECKQCTTSYMKKYNQDNKNVRKERNKIYRDTHQEQIKKCKEIYKPRRNELARERYSTDVKYCIDKCFRSRIYAALKGNSKSSSSLELLGCSVEFFKDWLEYNFYDDMNWDNYGTHWWLEHVRPCVSFDLTDPEQQKICFSWKNTTCLRADKNRSKHDKRDLFAELLQELKVKVYLSTIENANIKLQ